MRGHRARRVVAVVALFLGSCRAATPPPAPPAPAEVAPPAPPVAEEAPATEPPPEIEPPPAPPVPEALALAPQLTCLLGPRAACAGDERFGRNPGAPPPDTLELVGGRFHACRRDRDGDVECWGDSRNGQLGEEASEAEERCLGRPCRTRSGPVPGLGSPVSDLAAGAFHTCAVTREGAVLCWGDSRLGQLGRSAPGPVAAPVEGLPGPAIAVVAGELHSCALLAAGRGVYCWGDGSEGQLGSAAHGATPAPVEVAGLPPVRQLATGGEHTCALTEAGAVLCWGSNRFGELGDGAEGDRATPRPVSGLEAGAVELAAGDRFTCGRLATGEVRCWGVRQLGQLGAELPPSPPGERAALSSRTPVTVELASPASAIAAAGDHACASIASGEIQCWGANERGQLGDGTREDRATPARWSGVSPSDPADPSVVVGEAGASAGLDVSYHSGGVDFHGARAAGHGFGFTLATAGEDFRDPLLPSHWARLAEAGLHRGVYHFFVAADDPASQAEWFLSQLALEEGDLPPVVDIETLGDDPPNDLADRLRLFLETVEAEVGARPILYTGPAFWNRHLGEGFGEYPLWIAHYDVPQPTVPRGWTGWTFWQWKGDARVEGVGDPLDLNRLAPGVVLKDLLLGKRDEGPEPSDAGD